MGTWKKIVFQLFDMLYIPDDLTHLKNRAFLHVSDTPSSFYPVLKRLIKFFNPCAVIHTGDLADEIKLGLYPSSLPQYCQKLYSLAPILEEDEKRDVIIVLGNHDNGENVKKVFKRSETVKWSGKVTLKGLHFNLSHDYKGLPRSSGALNLFGHDQYMPECVGREIYLNGLLSIHLIDPDEGEVYHLPYPRFVDQNRLLRRKRGL